MRVGVVLEADILERDTAKYDPLEAACTEPALLETLYIDTLYCLADARSTAPEFVVSLFELAARELAAEIAKRERENTSA